jgi:hypothetical protein
VTRKARIRATAAASVALIVGLLLASGVVPNTFALWQAEATNAGSVFAGGWIPPPAPISDSVTGASNNQVQLSWTSGHSATEPNPNPVTGQQLQIADGGSSGSASCGSYANEGSALSATATSTTDGGGSVPIADWWCYRMVSTSATAWTSSGTFSPIRLFVPTSVAISCSGTGCDGQPDSGDTIVITFNQNVTLSGSPTGLCLEATSLAIAIGYSSCSDGVQGSVGTISGLSFVKKTGGVTANISASGNQVTVNVTASGSKQVTGVGSFTAGSAVTSSSGGLAACTSAPCQPSANANNF